MADPVDPDFAEARRRKVTKELAAGGTFSQQAAQKQTDSGQQFADAAYAAFTAEGGDILPEAEQARFEARAKAMADNAAQAGQITLDIFDDSRDRRIDAENAAFDGMPVLAEALNRQFSNYTSELDRRAAEAAARRTSSSSGGGSNWWDSLGSGAEAPQPAEVDGFSAVDMGVRDGLSWNDIAADLYDELLLAGWPEDAIVPYLESDIRSYYEQIAPRMGGSGPGGRR